MIGLQIAGRKRRREAVHGKVHALGTKGAKMQPHTTATGTAVETKCHGPVRCVGRILERVDGVKNLRGRFAVGFENWQHSRLGDVVNDLAIDGHAAFYFNGLVVFFGVIFFSICGLCIRGGGGLGVIRVNNARVHASKCKKRGKNIFHVTCLHECKFEMAKRRGFGESE